MIQVLFKKAGDDSGTRWAHVSGLAGWAFFDMKDECSNGLREKFKQSFIASADELLQTSAACGYGAAMKNEDYGWGSNMVVLNRGMVLASAYKLTGKKDYKTAAQRQMDYLLGVNAVGYSYVTGVGENAFKNPHNRVTVSDGIDETIPGFVPAGVEQKSM